MSDEDPVDVKVELSKKVAPSCAKHKKEYDECGKRLEKLGPDSGKNCAGWYNEYWKCMDDQVNTAQHSTTQHNTTRHHSSASIALLSRPLDLSLCWRCHRLQISKELFSRLK